MIGLPPLPRISGTPVAGQALPAVNWTIQAGLKRDLGLLTAIATDRRVHPPLGPLSGTGAPVTTCRFATLSARLATGRLVFKPLRSVEFLLTRRKGERFIAVPAVNYLVLVHGVPARSLSRFCVNRRVPYPPITPADVG